MLHPELHDLPDFKQWLVTTLEPMCDADPLVMSEYIVALLKHDAPMSNDQWKEFIARELVDFLEDKAKPFVEDLMVTLQTRSFVPEAPVVAPAINPASAAAGAGPTPVSSYRPGPPSDAPTGPSMPQQIYQPEAGPSSGRTSNGQPRSQVPEGDVEMGDGSAADLNRKCRDYHGKGYCMRGVNCPYEHSEDVIIPTPEMMFGQFPFAPPGHPMDGRGRGRGRGGRGGRGGPPMHGHPGAPPFPFMPQFPFPGPPGPPGPPGHPGPHGPPPQRRSGGPNNDNREFWGINKPPEDRNGNTLVITDIPNQKLSVQPIRDYFSQFGEVTNVALEARSARALVSFTSNAEAYQAWKSDEAVFGSRHVKVLWHRPRPGQGAAGAEALEKSAKLIANLKAIEQGGSVGVQGEKKAILAGPEARLAATLAELEAKDRRGKKETLIAEQKVLLKRASEGTQEEKKAILVRLKELAKEVEELSKPAPKKEENGDVEMGQSEESRLGQELAKYGMETKSQGEQDELMKLNAQLSALREKATTLGIPASTAARYSPYSRGSPIRARGRGRGRGGPPRPMRLDNRTREIVIAGEAFHSDVESKAVREYFESTGGLLEAYEGGVKVAYPNREMAEKVLAMGTKEIPELNGKFSATWYTGASQPSTTTDGSHAPEVEMVEEAQRGEREDED